MDKEKQLVINREVKINHKLVSVILKLGLECVQENKSHVSVQSRIRYSVKLKEKYFPGNLASTGLIHK